MLAVGGECEKDRQGSEDSGRAALKTIDRRVICKRWREKTGHGDATPYLNDLATRRGGCKGDARARTVTTLRNQSAVIRAVESHLDSSISDMQPLKQRATSPRGDVPAALFDVNGLVDRLISPDISRCRNGNTYIVDGFTPATTLTAGSQGSRRCTYRYIHYMPE